MDPYTAEPLEKEPEVMDLDDNPEFEDQPDNNEDPEEPEEDEVDDDDAEEGGVEAFAQRSRLGGDLDGGDPAIERGPQVEDLPDSEREEINGPRM